MLQQSSPHSLQQHSSEDLYANSTGLIHHHHLSQQQQQQPPPPPHHQFQQQDHIQQHPPAPMSELHLPQGYPFFNSSPHSRKSGLDDFVSGHHPQNSGLHTGILEMRKEKSRDAARSRRGKENYEFYELAKMLPLPPAITSQLDKASIIRLTISFLRLKEFSSNGDPPWIKEHPSSLAINNNSSSSAPSSTSSKSTKGRSRSSSHQQQQQQQQNHHHHHHHHHQSQQQLQHNNHNLHPHQSQLSHLPVPASVHVELFDQHQGTHILQSLDGFTFSLGSDGRFLYISETVSIYLGLSQVEMTGSSVFDYVHVADHAELAQQLGLTLATTSSQASGSSSAAAASTSHQQLPLSPASPSGSVDDGTSSMNPDVTSLMSLESNAAYQGLDRSFCIRMKSTLTKRGCHFKSSGYRVVMVLCRLRPQGPNFAANKSSMNGQAVGAQGQAAAAAAVPLLGMIAMAIALPPPTVHEVRLEPDMFVTRVAFDFRIIHCEPRIAELLEFVAEDLTGRSLYTLCHAEDVRLLRKAHTDLMHKGQVMTPYYRILNRHGGFTWIQSCATVVCNSKNGDEQSIVCVNYVLSRTEMKNLIVDQCQLESAPPITIKSTFKVDHGAAADASPEESSSECSDSLVKNTIGNELHTSSVTTGSEQSRPSSEVEVEVVAPLTATEEGGSTTTRAASIRPTGRNHQSHRSAKRKYEDLSSSVSTTDASGIAAMEQQQNITENSSSSSESVSIQHHQQSELDQQAELDAARWKRLYAGAIDGDGLQDRDLEGASNFSADALLSGGKQRPTIQWIGAPPQSGASSSGALSVPSLLRQLYASRESVIRANVHAAAAAAAGRSTSGYHFANGETLASAPGGGNGVGDANCTDVFPTTSSHSYHSASNGIVASANFLPDYLPAMTPPSSVSPRDAAAGALFAAEASLRHHSAYSSGLGGTSDPSYGSNSAVLKSHHHVYGHSSVDHHHHGLNHHSSTGSHHQYATPVQPLVPADAGQFYSHAPSGFHLYHSQVTGKSPAPAASANNSAAATWYPN